MGFLLAVLSFVVAEEVVELEPVQSGTYDCNLLIKANPDDTDETNCNNNPYCYFNGTGKTCIDDPCLAVATSSNTQCEMVNNVPCTVSTVSKDHDCVDGSGAFCRSTSHGPNGTTPAFFDYCFWAQLRDGACPVSVCQVGGSSDQPELSKKCIKRTSPSECQYLNSEDECKLTPKCMWRSTNCIQDPCFFGSADQPCATWTNPSLPVGEVGALNPGDCVLYQPYKADGTVSSYCVYKNLNKSPNLCYFLNPATDPNNATDYLQTYPTYQPDVANTNPKCTGEVTGCDSNPSGECSTKVNSKGAFAGLYCGDATHGAANILHVPSLVVFLLAFIIVSKFTL